MNVLFFMKQMMWTYVCIRGNLFILLVTLDLSDISFVIQYNLKFSTLSRFALGVFTCGIRAQVTTLGPMVSIHIFPKTNKCIIFFLLITCIAKNCFTKLQEDMVGRRSPTPLVWVELNNEDQPNSNIVNNEILEIVRKLQQ